MPGDADCVKPVCPMGQIAPKQNAILLFYSTPAQSPFLSTSCCVPCNRVTTKNLRFEPQVS